MPATRNGATRRLKLHTLSNGCAMSSEHTLNPQTPRLKRQPLLRIREKRWLRPAVLKGVWHQTSRMQSKKIGKPSLIHKNSTFSNTDCHIELLKCACHLRLFQIRGPQIGHCEGPILIGPIQQNGKDIPDCTWNRELRLTAWIFWYAVIASSGLWRQLWWKHEGPLCEHFPALRKKTIGRNRQPRNSNLNGFAPLHLAIQLVIFHLSIL